MRSQQKNSGSESRSNCSSLVLSHQFVFQSLDDDDCGDSVYQCPAVVAAAVVQPNLAPPTVAAAGSTSPVSMSSRSLASVEPIYQSTSFGSADDAACHSVSHVSSEVDSGDGASSWQGRTQLKELRVTSDEDVSPLCHQDDTSCYQTQSLTESMSDAEVEQIHTFFASYKTEVTVCPAVARLHLRSNETAASIWRLQYTGVPVLLVDAGEARARSQRRLQLVLAERGTGFVLWRDVLDEGSEYLTSVDEQAALPSSIAAASFHTMRASCDRRRLVGLAFDDATAASAFSSRLQAECRVVAEASVAGSGGKRRGKTSRASRRSAPRKLDISMPCCFQHVSGVTGNNVGEFFSFQSLVGQKP